MRSRESPIRAIAALALALACALACAPGRPPATPSSGEFSGARALARVHALLDHYPRALGDPRRGAAIDRLERDLLAAGADVVDRLEHEGVDPRGGRRFHMTSLLGHVRPEARVRFLLGTHLDTRPWAESDPDPARRDAPIPGANDGTSGLAVVLELAPLLAARLPDDTGVTIALFDGEELGRPEGGLYCAGSRALAAALARGEFSLVARARFAVILDMVGDPELRIQPEDYSLAAAPGLVDAIWSKGQQIAPAVFDATPLGRGVLDDHVPLIDAGIPAALVIDHDDPAWHTHADNRQNVARGSLERVGQVVLAALVELADAPAR